MEPMQTSAYKTWVEFQDITCKSRQRSTVDAPIALIVHILGTWTCRSGLLSL